jgi:hypothetical protein
MSAQIETRTAPAIADTPARWITAGRVTSGIAVLFLAFDASFKLVAPAAAVAATPELGWAEGQLPYLGLLELALLVVYLVPRTSVLGALLFTGYLGGAVATHARVGSPLFSHLLFPVYVAAILWAGLWLRDASVRALLPLRVWMQPGAQASA